MNHIIHRNDISKEKPLTWSLFFNDVRYLIDLTIKWISKISKVSLWNKFLATELIYSYASVFLIVIFCILLTIVYRGHRKWPWRARDRYYSSNIITRANLILLILARTDFFFFWKRRWWIFYLSSTKKKKKTNLRDVYKLNGIFFFNKKVDFNRKINRIRVFSPFFSSLFLAIIK